MPELRLFSAVNRGFEDAPPQLSGTPDSTTAGSPQTPTSPVSPYDPDFGTRVRNAYEKNMYKESLREVLRVRNYGEEVCKRYKRGETPETYRVQAARRVKEAWQQMAAESDTEEVDH